MQNQKITKRQRRLIKKQQEQNERIRIVQRKKAKKIISIFSSIILVVVVILITINYLSDSNSENNDGIAKIEINPQQYNAGTVSMSDGLVEHVYEIKNIGDNTLNIDRIWTSCMCTTAILTIGKKQSPKFGMHDNPAFWKGKLFPGETGYLKVVFDPAFHGPSGVGQAIRIVYISTNDPQNEKAQIRLFANVVP